MADTAVHPDLRRLARVLPRGVVGPRILRGVRVVERLAKRRPPPAGVSVERAGAVEVRVHRPPGAGPGPLPALLWIHGGGYVMGLAAQDDRLCGELARRLGAVVAAVDYRVAPEHPYPTPLHDCHDALEWLAARPDVDAGRVAIAGGSAGGGLAAALALLARRRRGVQPVFQALSYPMLDDRTVLRDDVDERHLRLWTNASNRFGWAAYLGAAPGSAGVDATAAPGREDDLAGLPPAWIGVGSHDLFHDEDLRYAQRLRAAGVPCEVTVVDGAFHGFDALVPRAQVSRAFRGSQVAALAAALRVLPSGTGDQRAGSESPAEGSPLADGPADGSPAAAAMPSRSRSSPNSNESPKR